MEKTNRLLTCLIMAMTIGTAMCATAEAQDYVAPRVSISKDKVKIGGKVFYSHIVLEKQTLYSLSKAYDVSIEDIYKYNPSVRENGLRTNDILIIPSGEVIEDQTESTEVPMPVFESEQMPEPVQEPAPVPEPMFEPAPEQEQVSRPQIIIDGEIRHTVKWYDDLSSIATLYGVSEEAIMQANGLENGDISGRQVLIIPGSRTTTYSADFGAGGIADSLYTKEYIDTLPQKINATLILPFKATGTSSSRNYMDFYSGALIAMKELTDSGIDLHLSVYDIADGAAALPAEELKESTIIFGPIAPNDLTAIHEMTGGACPIVSPLDQRGDKLASKYSNFIQAPATHSAQFKDLIDWIIEEHKEGDRVIVISEKGGNKNDPCSELRVAVEKSGLDFIPFSYGILEGRGIQYTLQGNMTRTGVNRVVIASENEPFVNDALRNLNIIAHNKYNVATYAPVKVKNFETIEADHLHKTQLHICAGFNIDYDDHQVQNFLVKYRSIFKTEPSQFAFQGYDLMKYFITVIAKHRHDWMSHLSEEGAEMLQSKFRFKTNGYGGYHNTGIRRVRFLKDFKTEVIL